VDEAYLSVNSLLKYSWKLRLGDEKVPKMNERLLLVARATERAGSNQNRTPVALVITTDVSCYNLV
jgi:hypothetical protein